MVFERCDIQARSILLRGFFDLYEWRRQHGYEVCRLRCPSRPQETHAKATCLTLHIAQPVPSLVALCPQCPAPAALD